MILYTGFIDRYVNPTERNGTKMDSHRYSKLSKVENAKYKTKSSRHKITLSKSAVVNSGTVLPLLVMDFEFRVPLF